MSSSKVCLFCFFLHFFLCTGWLKNMDCVGVGVGTSLFPLQNHSPGWTLQTAVGVFGGEDYTNKTDVLPFMVANAGNSSRAAISSLNCPPIVAVELCREHLGVYPCDRRSSISEYQFLFLAVDFSLIDSDEDYWWKANIRETKEELAARGLKFLNWYASGIVRNH